MLTLFKLVNFTKKLEPIKCFAFTNNLTIKLFKYSIIFIFPPLKCHQFEGFMLKSHVIFKSYKKII